ncbi:nose resistant to fluoxetine protein 6-like [Thrips palmi]|uniref:Nose resistant to fluoxetine protein 6-like n=1 Tax=Thrips palmi TaxID=161013 RepID=A0A6P8YMG7_THRPL|nr:nose resistant to fluoxetine protein 6-like [Thrips palmi]
MFCIILGHRLFHTIIAGPSLNPNYLENGYTSTMKMVVANGTGIVAIFFVISGFLEARTMMTLNAKLPRFTATFLLSHYAIRYVRLVPALAVALAIQTQWMQYMGSGPLWGQLVGKLTEDCQQNWWSHLLFINNYQGTFCMVQTWFLASVVQMFLLTPPLMWLVSRWTQRALWPGCLLLGLLLAASAVVLYATTVHLGLLPTWIMYPEALRHVNVATNPTFVYQYVRTHTNALPYVVGLLAGALFYLANRDKWQPSKTVVTLLWLGIPFSLALSFAIIFIGVVFNLPSFEARPLLDALYGPARLLGFSLPSAWIIFTCGMGHGGLFNSLLTWRPLVVMGRLTYSVYLMHLTFTIVATSSVRHPIYLSDYTIVSQTLSDIVVAYAVGLVLYFCVEAPMMNLQTIAFTHWFRRKSGSAGQTAERSLPDQPVQQARNVPANAVTTSM